MFWFAFFPDKESERILLEEIKEKEEQEEKRKVAKNAIEDALGKDKPGSKYKSF